MTGSNPPPRLRELRLPADGYGESDLVKLDVLINGDRSIRCR